MSTYSTPRSRASTAKVDTSHAATYDKGQYDITDVNWRNIETRFKELMALMDTPATGVNALEVRAVNRQRIGAAIAALLNKAQEGCRLLLLEGDAEAAEKAGVKVLRLRERFYKPNHIELIPAYLHLARTKQFLELYGDAEDMLSLAQYIMLKHPNDVTVTMKADLHQAFGLLYATDGKLEAAVKQLSCATYYLSLLHGPQHVLTTFSYFDLGNVFAAKASMESAMSMYDAVKEIWYTHLIAALDDVVARRAEMQSQLKYSDHEREAELRHACYATAHAFGRENMMDASKMLHGICRIQEERFQQEHPSPVRAQFVLGLFLLWMEDEEEAQRYLSTARKGLQRFYGPRHPIVCEIEEWCDKFGLSYADDVEADDGTDMEAAETSTVDGEPNEPAINAQ
ncbi:hypothetical protein ABB37_00679 [Leptomonas pyrrhocoris]|uniref:TAX-1 n=1 Tax=Leptomonas pyrrhocoris TaxID=157538 RepID=A0A0M9GAX8_LEPPY|nr:hypothetical protein ABB37_00679 [Leptomonas pyrrhocoris]XP_015664976.1 hypothetical protein ABB37_00679 [Leptomonas pyrrhocoris]KPA86536.1 hypothetical protein ABB37_00679 [Leptomonas pyrrhocoris]KPA86537.1 hypothetical protein ABB37_00679 [Leptomonas pyrrhocoris]|eukprot:XP_015664975.1 hypothetical protein ABB37_00679 [Leptomonas pyrrhocoris]